MVAGAGLRGWQAAHPHVARASVDERIYAALARTLAEDLHYGDQTSGPRHPFIAAPGAPLAFAAARRVTPSPPGSSTDIPAAYWLLAVVGTLLVVAAFALGRELGGAAAGLLAAGAVAYYLLLVRTTGELLSEPFGALALTLAVLALVTARRSGRRRLLAGGGALLGAAALARGDLLVALLACPLVFLALGAAEGRWRSGASDAATVLAAGVLVVAPWVGYASVRSHSLVPVVETDATTLLVGTYLPGDGGTTGFKRALAGETRARFRGCGAAATSGHAPGEAVIETARAPSGARLPAALRAEASRTCAATRWGARAPSRDDGPETARMWRRPSQARSPAAAVVHASSSAWPSSDAVRWGVGEAARDTRDVGGTRARLAYRPGHGHARH